MADKKISALTSAATPLAGTEVLPLVQSGSTVKVAVSDLTAGRAVSAASLALTTSPLPATSGGTGQSSSFTSSGVAYASSTSALSTAGNLKFSGKDLQVGLSTVSYGANISGITLDNTGANQNIVWRVNGTTTAAAYTNGTASFIFGTENSSPLQLQIAGVVKAELQTDGDLSLSNGNFVQGTAAKGVNFTANTPAAGMTSQLLNWYEEGTWTPVPTASSGAITSYTSSGRYTRIGRSVVLSFNITITNNGTGAGVLFATGMPYAANAVNLESGVIAEVAVVGFSGYTVFNTTTKLSMGKYDNTYPGGTNHVIVGQITYQV